MRISPHIMTFFLALAALAIGQQPEQKSTVDQDITNAANNAPLSMTFTGKTAEDCKAWQAKFKSRLMTLLGPHTPPKKWRTIIEKIDEFKDHTRKQLILTADDHPPLPIYLLIPKMRSDKKLPGIVAIHGHGNYGYDPVAGRDDLPGVANAIKNANYDYGRQLVKRGYVVAVPCLTPFGRRLGDRSKYGKQDPCAVTFVRMQLLGRVLMAENLRDCLWGVELLAQHPMVDAERLGCVGLSYGGRMTMLTAALDPRIKVAVISGALNVMQERIMVRYSCGAQVIPGLLKNGDVPEIISLIAPRWCVLETGSKDGLIKPLWAADAMKRIQRSYKAYGHNDRLIRDEFEGGHRWNGVVTYPLLKKVLQRN